MPEAPGTLEGRNALPEETKRKRYRVDSDRGTNEEADDYDWESAGGLQLEEILTESLQNAADSSVDSVGR